MPETSFAWYEELRKSNDPYKAMDKAMKVWAYRKGDFGGRDAEVSDPYLGRYFGEKSLDAFRDAGGHGVDEAAALFDLLAGNADRAAASLQSLYSKTGELRLRNTALGAFHAALLQARGSR